MPKRGWDGKVAVDRHTFPDSKLYFQAASFRFFDLEIKKFTQSGNFELITLTCVIHKDIFILWLKTLKKKRCDAVKYTES